MSDYNEIDWNNVESAIATEEGLQITYRAGVGVGQTYGRAPVLIPRGGELRDMFPYGKGSPPGSYGQIPPVTPGGYQIRIVSNGQVYDLGSYSGKVLAAPNAPAISKGLWSFVCAWLAQHPNSAINLSKVQVIVGRFDLGWWDFTECLQG